MVPVALYALPPGDEGPRLGRISCRSNSWAIPANPTHQLQLLERPASYDRATGPREPNKSGCAHQRKIARRGSKPPERSSGTGLLAGPVHRQAKRTNLLARRVTGRAINMGRISHAGVPRDPTA